MTASGLSYKTANVELKNGTTVRPCQPGEAVCTVRRNPSNADEEAKEVMRFGPGDSFGERALLANSKIPQSVTAVGGPVKVSCVSRDEFEEVLGPLQSIVEMDRKFKERNAVQKELVWSPHT